MKNKKITEKFSKKEKINDLASSKSNKYKKTLENSTKTSEVIKAVSALKT